jgi:hypothetical protein
MITVRVIPSEAQPRKEGEPVSQSISLEPGKDGCFSHPTFMEGMIVKPGEEYSPEGHLIIYFKRDYDCLFDFELSLVRWASAMGMVSYKDETIPEGFFMSIDMPVPSDEPFRLSLHKYDRSKGNEGWKKLSDIEIVRNL